MNNQEYWAKRSAQQMWGYMEEAETVAKELTELYMEASNQVQDAAKKIFETYKGRYGLPQEEAERLLKMMSDPTDLRAVLRKLEEDPKNKDLIKQIEGQAYGSRLARLSSVYSQIEEVLMLLYTEQQKRTKALLEELARQAYYDKLFNLHQYSGYGFDFKTLSKKQIERVLNSRWYGANYSEKIWKNRDKLAEQLKKEIMLNLLTGRPLRDAAKSIEERFAVGYGDARRLIRTESCYTCNQLQLLSMKEHGVERYIYVAILDLKTSEVCRGLDKKDFAIEEAAAGKNFPPMHPWCRSTIISYVPKELLTKMKQSAIDPVTGERIKVSGDMTHKEWYEKFVKGKLGKSSKEQGALTSSSPISFGTNAVDLSYINSSEYRHKFTQLTPNTKVNDILRKFATGTLTKHNDTDTESLLVIDADTGADILRKVGNKNKLGIQLSDAEIATIKEYPGRKIGIHNHPSNLYPTGSDFGAAGYRGYDFGLVITHDGRIFKYSTGNTPVPSIVTDSRIDKYVRKGYTEQEQRNGFEKALNELGKEYGLTWKEIK